MTVTVRQFRPEDATAVAGVLRVAAPYWVFSASALRWQATHGAPAERRRMLLAEVDGEVVGVVRTGLLYGSAEPGLGYANVNVLPVRRGGGVGSALLAAAEDRLRAIGARVAHAMVVDEPAAVRFAERRGYQRGRRSVHLRLDLAAAVPSVPPVPDDVLITSAAVLGDDPRPLYEADLEASRDEPGDVGMDETGYADWRTTYWDRPDLDRDLTTVAICAGVVASFTFALTDGSDRYQSGMTGTRRAFRGRGLAGAVKRLALRRAAEAGFTTALTRNDAGNEAMLAVNRRLGYGPVAGEWRYRRTLSP